MLIALSDFSTTATITLSEGWTDLVIRCRPQMRLRLPFESRPHSRSDLFAQSVFALSMPDG